MTPSPTHLQTMQLPTKQKLNNFVDVRNSADAYIQPQSTNKNIVNYIDDIQKIDNIRNMPGCENIYDDNLAARALGYNNCANANADYFERNLDIYNKYGNLKSLAEICPVSTRTDMYMTCMKKLLDKYNVNADVLDNINNDMSDIMNKRLNNRSDLLNDIETSLNPYLFSKDQVNFNNTMTLGEPLNPTGDQILNYANNYYKLRNGISKNIFNNIPQSNIENFVSSNSEIYIIDPYIEQLFFGTYTPIKGQYLAFNNLTITLNYDIGKEITNTNTNKNTNSPHKVVLTIIDNNTNSQIIYSISNIDYYLQYKNVIKIDLSNQIINSVHQTDVESLQALLTTLGISTPGRLIMTVDEFTSSENITRRTYKILNANMSTIMVLEKNLI